MNNSNKAYGGVARDDDNFGATDTLSKQIDKVYATLLKMKSSRTNRDLVRDEEMMFSEFHRLKAAEQCNRHFIPEVIAKVGRQFAEAGKQVVRDLSDIIECAASVILEPRPAYAYAVNRGAEDADNLPQKAVLSKKGNGCELKIEIELADKDATVVIGLLGEDGTHIECFSVEFADAESGECLKRSATHGTLRFKNIAPGKYRIAASTEMQSCEFTLSIV